MLGVMSSEPAARKLVRQAVSLGKTRGPAADDRFREVVRLCTEAITIDPAYAKAYNHRGFAKSKLNDPLGAQEDFTKAIELEPEDATARKNRGYARNALSEYKEAIEDLDQAIRLFSEYATAYYARGFAKANLQRYDAAIADYDRAIELAGRNTRLKAQAHNQRGHAKSKQNKHAEAIADYDQAIELNPKHRAAYLNRSEAHTQAGNEEAARKDTAQATALAGG